MKTLTYSAKRKELIFEDGNIKQLPMGFFQEYQLARVANINLMSCLIFHANDFSYLRYLKKLYIVALALREISGSTFNDLILLKNLHFEAPRIERLPRNLLIELKKLEQIVLIVNRTRWLSVIGTTLKKVHITCSVRKIISSMFVTLINLSDLKITGQSLQPGEIMKVDCAYFKWLKNLEILNINRAHCCNVDLHPNLKILRLIECHVTETKFLLNLKKLTRLEIRNCINIKLQCSQITQNSGLKNLILTQNTISVLQENDLNNLTDFVYLDFSDCQIEIVQEKFLGNASKFLNVIKLHSNCIKTLRSNVFNNCKRLFILDLSNNHLWALWSRVFDSLHNLVTLDLHKNQLTDLPNKIFYRLNNLKRLNLSFNQFKQVLNNWFNVIDDYCLETVDLSANSIFFIDYSFFQTLPNLKFVNISKNQLSYLNIDLFENLELLTDLNLSDNRVRFLKNNVFKDLQSLQILKLDSNSISAIEAGTFDYVVHLRVLSLNNNYLTELPENVFKRNWELRFLNLSNNVLSSIAKNVFYHLGRLQELRLQSNRLRVLNVTYFERNNSLHSLYVDERFKKNLQEVLPKVRIISEI